MYLCILLADLNHQDKYLLKILLAGKKPITRIWLNREPPTVGEWSDTIKNIHEMDMMNFSRRLNRKKAEKYWLKWLININKKTV